MAAVCYALLGKEEERKLMVARLQRLFLEERQQLVLTEDSSELLYGHGGYLYCLLFVAKFSPSAISDQLINEVCRVGDQHACGCHSVF